jgi:hypothetical protein
MGEKAVKIRNMKARVLAKIDDYNTTAPPGLRIARGQKDVIEVIVGFIARGQVHPSYETIARLARTCTATVGTAIRNAAKAGLLVWSNTWQWSTKANRFTKTANHYALGNGCPAPVSRRIFHKDNISEAPQIQFKEEEKEPAVAGIGLAMNKSDAELYARCMGIGHTGWEVGIEPRG